MEKKNYKLIMMISLTLNVVFLVVVVVLLIGKNINGEQDKIKQYVGVYQNNNWNRGEAIIQLNEDMTCKTPNSSSMCKWNIVNNKLIFSFSFYKIKYNGNEGENPIISSDNYATLERCENYIKTRYPSYASKLSCEYEETQGTTEYTITNNSIVYHDHAFIKVS